MVITLKNGKNINISDDLELQERELLEAVDECMGLEAMRLVENLYNKIRELDKLVDDLNSECNDLAATLTDLYQ